MEKTTTKRSYKKLIYFGVFFVVLPLFFLSSFLVIKYQDAKPPLFTTTDLNGNEFTPKIVKRSKINSFVFEFRCKEYRDPNQIGNIDENGNVITSQILYFEARIFEKSDGITVTDVKYSLVVASKWIGYQSNKSSATALTFVSSDDQTFKQATISGFNQIYPAKYLIFFKVKSPTAYVLLEWIETNQAGKQTKKAYFLTYSYEEYMVEGVTKGGIEAY